MIITIIFPDGRRAEVELDPREYDSIEEMAYAIAYELCENNPMVKNVEKCAQSAVGWILPQLWSELINSLYGARVGGEE